MRNIIVTTPSFCKYINEPEEQLSKNGFEIIRDYGFKELRSFSEDKLNSIIGIIVGLELINKDVLDILPNVKIVVKHGAGIDNIDLNETKERGISVYNVPGANKDAVADATLSLMLSVSRMICQANTSVRSGKWERFYGDELNGKTLSLIGYGAIGQAVAQRAKGFGMRIVAFDVYKQEGLDVEYVDLDTAISNADYLSLHTPLLDTTYHLINSDRLSKMKDNAYLINTARGGLIDESALVDALRNNKLSGAAIDVHEFEPKVSNELMKFDNVILTPHLAGFTKEATNKISFACADFIIKEFVEKGVD